MKPSAFDYVRANGIAAATQLLSEAPETSRILSGGQSLGPLMNFRLAAPTLLIDVSGASDLRSAVLQDDTLVVGAAVTHAQIEDGQLPDTTKGLMQHVARGIAYRAVRNRGTIGGSLAHADPAADWVNAMLALDASVLLKGRSAERKMKVSDFITGPLTTAIEAEELIVAVLVPALSAQARWGHAKFTRKLGDFADSMAIAVFDPKRSYGRVVLGRRADLPAQMNATARAVTARDGSLDSAIDDDLAALRIDDEDHPLHRAMILRAIQDATR